MDYPHSAPRFKINLFSFLCPPDSSVSSDSCSFQTSSFLAQLFLVFCVRFYVLVFRFFYAFFLGTLLSISFSADPPISDTVLSETLQEQTDQYRREQTWVHGLSSDRYLIRYLEGIVARLQSQTGIQGKLRVSLIESDRVEAMVSGGDTVFVYRGLLHFLKSRSEVAGVLAHELAHLQNKDSHTGYRMDNDGLKKGLAGKIIKGHQQRQNEFRADHAGMKIMAEAGFNPQGFVSFLTRMQSLPNQGLRFIKNLESAINSLGQHHPQAEERIERAKRLMLSEGWEGGKPGRSLKRINSRETRVFEREGLSFSKGLKLFDKRYEFVNDVTWDELKSEVIDFLPGGQPKPENPMSRVLSILADKAQSEKDLMELSSRYKSLSVHHASIFVRNFTRILGQKTKFKNLSAPDLHSHALNRLQFLNLKFRPDLLMEGPQGPKSVVSQWSWIPEDEHQKWHQQSLKSLLNSGYLSWLLSEKIHNAAIAKSMLAISSKEALDWTHQLEDGSKSYLFYDYLLEYAKSRGIGFFSAAMDVLPKDGEFATEFLGRFLTLPELAKNKNHSSSLGRFIEHLPNHSELIRFLTRQTPEVRVQLLRSFINIGEQAEFMVDSGKKEAWAQSTVRWYGTLMEGDYADLVNSLSRLIKPMQEFSKLDLDFLLLFRAGLLVPSRNGMLSSQELATVLPLLSEKTRQPASDLKKAVDSGSSTENPMFRLLLLHGDRIVSRGHFHAALTNWLHTPQKRLRMKQWLLKHPVDISRRENIDKAVLQATESERGKNPSELVENANNSFGKGISGVLKMLDSLPEDFRFPDGTHGRSSTLKEAIRRMKGPKEAKALTRYLNTTLNRQAKRWGFLNLNSKDREVFKLGVSRVVDLETKSKGFVSTLKHLEALKSRLPFSRFNGELDDSILAEEMVRQFEEKATSILQISILEDAIAKLEIKNENLDFGRLRAAKYRKTIALRSFATPLENRLGLIEKLLPKSSSARDEMIKEYLAELPANLSHEKLEALKLVSSNIEASKLRRAEFRRFQAALPEGKNKFSRLIAAMQLLFPEPSSARDSLIHEVLEYTGRSEEEIRALQRLQTTQAENKASILLDHVSIEKWLKSKGSREIVLMTLEMVEADPDMLQMERMMLAEEFKDRATAFKALPLKGCEKALALILNHLQTRLKSMDTKVMKSWLKSGDMDFNFPRQGAVDGIVELIVNAWFQSSHVERRFLSWFLTRDLQYMPPERGSKVLASVLLDKRLSRMKPNEIFKLYMEKRGFFASRAHRIFRAFEWNPKLARQPFPDQDHPRETESKKVGLLDILKQEHPDLQIQELGRRISFSATQWVFEAIIEGRKSIMTVVDPRATQKIAEDILIYEKMLHELEEKPDLKKRFGIIRPSLRFNRVILGLLEELDLESRTTVLDLIKKQKNQVDSSIIQEYKSTQKSFILKIAASDHLISGAVRFNLNKGALARTIGEKFLSGLFSNSAFPAGLKSSGVLVTQDAKIHFAGENLRQAHLPDKPRRLLYRLLLQIELAKTHPSKQNLAKIALTLGRMSKTGTTISFQEVERILSKEKRVSKQILALFKKAGIKGNLIEFGKSLKAIEITAGELDPQFRLHQTLQRRLITHYLKRPLRYTGMKWQEILNYQQAQDTNSDRVRFITKKVLDYMDAGDRRDLRSIIYDASRDRGPKVKAHKFSFYKPEADESPNLYKVSRDGELVESVKRLGTVLKLSTSTQKRLLKRLSLPGSSTQNSFSALSKILLENNKLTPEERQRLRSFLKETSSDKLFSQAKLFQIIDELISREVVHRILKGEHQRGNLLKDLPALTDKAARKTVRIVGVLGRRASKKIAHSMHTVFTVAAMHMLTEYYYTRKTNPKDAVLSLLDAPEFWISMQASSIGALVVPKKFTRLSSISPGMEKFAGVLQPMVQNLAVLVTWDIATAYATRAMEGLTKEGELLTMSEIFDSPRLLRRYLKNLFSVVADPKAASEVFPHLFKYRWLSAEFGTILVGMSAGSRIGASLGGSAIVAGPQAGAIGRTLGGFIGAVGGAVGASIPGRKIDIFLMRRGIKEKREELRQSLVNPPSGDFQKDYKRAGQDLELMKEYEQYREQLVGLLSSFYMKDLVIQVEAEGDQDPKQKAVTKRDLDQQKNEILSLFQADQKMFQSILERDDISEPLREMVVSLENDVVLGAGILEAQFLRQENPQTKSKPTLESDHLDFESLEN